MIIPNTTSTLTRTAWIVVVLLVPVGLLNYLDRQMLSTMKSSVMISIPTIENNANWGLMLGQFKWVYAFLSPLGGYLADRFSRRYTVCLSLFVWSLVTWWTGHVTTFNELLLTRSLMGISEAFYMPAALALIADYHTGGTRSRAIGFHQMAIYCGVMAGGFGGYVADAPMLGWRFAFTACGVVGMLYALPLVVLLRDAPRAESSEPMSRTDPVRSFVELFSNPSFQLLVFYFTLPAVAAWVVRDWMPAILKTEFRIEQRTAGIAATMPWLIAAIVGAFVGGWLADRWTLRNIRGRIYVSAIGMSLIVPAIYGVGFEASKAQSLNLVMCYLVLFGLGWGFFDGNNMPILSQIVRPELRATGYGIMNFVSIGCGGIADWGFGKLRDEGVSLNLIFGLFAGAAIVSVILVLLIRPRNEATEVC